MTSEQTACQALLGEKIGSIRRICHAPDSADTGASWALEIETKTGRIVHVGPAQDGACLIGTGPAPAPVPAMAGSIRSWQDLTAEAPFAFDGRPVVTRMEALYRAGRPCGCVMEFSNGGRLTYDLDSDGLLVRG